MAGEQVPRSDGGQSEIPVPPATGARSGDFPRSVRSEGVSRPPSIWEIETHREHIRLNLENWEKQWVDVLRYERAKVQDDADAATIRRALTRAGAGFAMTVSAALPVASDAPKLQAVSVGSTDLAGMLVALAAASAMLSLASLWYAAHVAVLRRRFEKGRTRPLLPPERLDATQLLATLETYGDPLYYRERDADPDMDFGWKSGLASPPEPERRD